MKPIDELTLEGETYTVVEKPMGAFKRAIQATKSPADFYYGRHNRGRHEFVVTVPQTHHDYVDTIVHEMLHVCAFRSGLSAVLGLNEEEAAVGLLTPWLVRLLQENPGLVTLITEEG